MAKQHRELIEFLQQNNFKADCAQCGSAFFIKDAPLFPIDEFTPEAKELFTELKVALKERKAELKQRTLKTKQKVETTTKSVNIGFILERLAPVLESFPFERNDCRSLFDPIDYVIFEGLHNTGKVQKIFFVDIKSGAAKLKKNQKAIKEAIEQKRVDFKLYK
ncbi:MAG: Holliday junction resolvase-like protein [bacterium]